MLDNSIRWKRIKDTIASAMAAGAIAGGVIGGVAFAVFAIALLLWYNGFFCHRRLRLETSQDIIPSSIHRDCVQIVTTCASDGGAVSVVHENATPQRAPRKKLGLIVDAVLSQKFPRDKEPATVANSGIHFVDHHFVVQMPRR